MFALASTQIFFDDKITICSLIALLSLNQSHGMARQMSSTPAMKTPMGPDLELSLSSSSSSSSKITGR